MAPWEARCHSLLGPPLIELNLTRSAVPGELSGALEADAKNGADVAQGHAEVDKHAGDLTVHGGGFARELFGLAAS